MTGKMKAQVFYEANVMKFEEIDIPQIADNEVLVKVKACGICGSDVSYYYGHSPLGTATGKGPLVLGHEFSGEIVEVGGIPKSLGLFKAGDRVTCNPVVQCNSCMYCSEGKFNVCPNCVVNGVSVNGAFAEYAKISYTHVYKIADNVSYEQASLVEPLACACFGMKQLDIKLGELVVVFGPGPIGLMMAQMAKASGASKVIMVGIIDYALKMAKDLGVDAVVNTLEKSSPYYAADIKARIKELTNGHMADKVIVPTNAMVALQQAYDVAGLWGTIVYFGLPGDKDIIQIPALDFIQTNKTIKSSWLAPLTWPTAITMLASGIVKTDKLVSHKFKLDEVEKGIKFMKEGKEDKMKGIIVMG